MSFYEQITILCTKKGISVNKMCADIGLSNATATQWKKGATPTARTLERIAEYFGTTALELAKALATAEALCKYREKYATEQAEIYGNPSQKIYITEIAKLAYAYICAQNHIQKAINQILEIEIDVDSKEFKNLINEFKNNKPTEDKKD